MLAKLRAPFPPEMIEKLPKPTFKGAWDGKRAGNCPTCHGYHVLDNCIHLDYVGHANVTNRLLEVDPFWEWEPMAYTEQGTPLFTGGGLLDNVPRSLPDGLGAQIESDAWPTPPIFGLIHRLGDVPDDDMFRTFNMGVGMVIVVDPDAVNAVRQVLGADAYRIGRVVPWSGTAPRVVIA